MTENRVEQWETPEGAISISAYGRREICIKEGTSGLVQIKITSGDADSPHSKKFYQIIEVSGDVADHLSARLKRLASVCEIR